MTPLPMTGAVAEYRGIRYRILFANSDWLALRVNSDAVVPDAIARGERRLDPAGVEQWAKVPVDAIDAVIDVRVSGLVGGQRISLQEQMSDGRVRVGFVGSPVAAKALGLEGDQHMGWVGLFEPDEISHIEVTETRRG